MKTLERHLGLLYVVSISLGAMLGAGLFVLPGMAVAYTGSQVWLAFLIAGICVLPAALSKSELATAMPSSGGTYLYIERAFGPLVGTIGGVGLWLSLILKTAFALIGLSWYLGEVVSLSPVPTALFFLALIVFLNITGIRKVSKAQTWMVGLALLGLAGLSPMALEVFNPELFLPPDDSDFTWNLLGGVAFVYTGYAGVTKVAAVAEEVKNPGRNLPLGMLLSLAIATFLYTIVSYGLVGILDAYAVEGMSPREVPGMKGDYRVMYTLANFLAGPVAGQIMAVLGVLIILSLGNAGVLASSRFPFAMSRDKLAPSMFGRVHPRYMTPVVSILATGLVLAILIVTLDIMQIAKLASSLKLVIFMAVNVCVLVFRETGATWYKPKFRTPLYPWLQIAGILVGGFLLYLLGFEGLLALLGMIIPGVLVFVLYGRRFTDSQGVLALRAPREELRLEAARALIEHQDILPGEAKVVVALQGNERSPENLVEIGGSLASGAIVDVMHVTDVPEQVTLDSMLDEDPGVTSLRRRIKGLAEDHDMQVTFDPVVTRDVLRTIHDTTVQVHCFWLVMEWRDDPYRRFLRTTPIGWLGDHLACNFGVFRDSGARTFKEILVLPKPGPHDALVVQTAENIADEYGAKVTFGMFVPAGEHFDVQEAGARKYLEQVSRLCREPDRSSTRIIRGDKEIATVTKVTAEYDLLVLAAPPVKGLMGQIRVPVAERITQFAGCSVLQVKTPGKETHAAVENVGMATHGLQLAEYVTMKCVEVRLDLSRKEALFARFAAVLGAVIPEVTEKELESALWEREKIQNTGVGEGVALPHATLAGLKRSFLGVFTTSAPVSYGGAENVDVFFVMVGPPEERQTHLVLLSKLARMAITPDILGRIREAQDVASIIEELQLMDALSDAAESQSPRD